MNENDNLWKILQRLDIDTNSDDFEEKDIAGRTIGVNYTFDTNTYHVFDAGDEYDVIVREY
ncbi:hypothetical protein [Haloarcula argentinensis]|uniref:Uncharacterized protein n=1 Tax=Haloarcula argentinensis TaxID=43776 RepID=A0A847UKV8_HALAR|nr:hypothetical protein [Haloarcula argentinensis]NLV12201.1 hypothetical protein [Haloarcula argentinensis]